MLTGGKHHPFVMLWGVLLGIALGTILVPLDSSGRVDLGQLIGAPHDYFTSLPGHVYPLIKSAILWAPVGFLYSLAGVGCLLRIWAPVGVLSLLVFGIVWFPDPGFRLVAEILYAIPGLALGGWLAHRAQQGSPLTVPLSIAPGLEAEASMPTVDALANRPAVTNQVESRPLGRAAAALVAALLLFSLYRFPMLRVELALGLAAYGIVLWRHASTWLVVLPPAVALLDLAHWSGRFFWDEFDLLILMTLAVALWQNRVRADAWRVHKLRGLLAAFLGATVVSLLLGLFPLQGWDLNAFTAYWSHYNGLRLAKGIAWGLVTFALYRSMADRDAAFLKLAAGMALGVLGVSVWALWEQMQFAGASTTLDYRVTASFSSMHTGGGHFEAYLVLALPFVWGGFFLSRNTLYRAAMAAIFLLGAYAMLSTVARGGAIALAVALAVLIGGTWRARSRQVQQRTRFVAPVLLGLLTVAVLVAGVSSGFWKQRIGQTSVDAGIRWQHWAEVMAMRDSGFMTALFGQGLGTLPATTFASRLPVEAGSYRYLNDHGNPYLALNSAGTLYMAQRVPPRPGQTLTLELAARAPAAEAGLEVSLCEKNLFNSRQCQWLKFKLEPGSMSWQTLRQRFASGEVGAGNWLTRRPVQLSLYNPVAGTVVEIAAVRLLDGQGNNVLRNGDFARGGDFWLFKSGDHLLWHAKNLWVHLLFEQGWLGVGLFGLILLLALVRLARPMLGGSQEATAWLAAVAALVTIGMVESFMDAPRLAQFVIFLLCVGASWGSAFKPRSERARRTRHRSRRHARADEAPVV